MKRPISLTVVGWLLLILNAISLIFMLATLRNAQVGEAFGSFALPAWATIGFGVFVQLVTIAAAIGILKGQRWGRNTYLGISVLGLLVGSFNLPSVGMLIPGLVVFLIVAFFLLRASATAYFNRTTAA
ncbi:hypothetical protein [Ralstonia syzygii]|uniref:Transmembrane protein n=1 Tax=Ralstonia syzygii R24 TaxID=907261 RepID=G3A3G7_9RALS|nr:hypothetical protein [Ralstonia syzygii]CCA88411.1 conserved membrane hypothetical protein [Ralstonia syzygii R24]